LDEVAVLVVYALQFAVPEFVLVDGPVIACATLVKSMAADRTVAAIYLLNPFIEAPAFPVE
jgi:hypothetical protein